MTINFPEGSLRGGTELLVRTVAVLLLAVPDALLAAAWDENQPTAPKSSNWAAVSTLPPWMTRRGMVREARTGEDREAV